EDELVGQGLGYARGGGGLGCFQVAEPLVDLVEDIGHDVGFLSGFEVAPASRWRPGSRSSGCSVTSSTISSITTSTRLAWRPWAAGAASGRWRAGVSEP